MSEVASTPVATPVVPNAPATPTAEPKFKVKVNGQEREVTADELVRRFQKEEAADEKFRKASEWEKERQEYEKDEWYSFKKRGLNPEEAAERLLIKKLQLEQMSPAEKKAYDAEQRANQLEAKIKAKEVEEAAEKERASKEQLEQLQYQAAQEIDFEFTNALKEAGIKPTPRIIARMADEAIAHLTAKDGLTAQDYKRLDAKKAFENARTGTLADFIELATAMKPADLVAALPKNVLDAIRKYQLDDALSQNPISRMSRGSQKSEPTAKANSTRMSTDKLFDRLEKKFSST